MIVQSCKTLRGLPRSEVRIDGINYQQAERESQQMQASHEEMVERMTRAIREDGTLQPLPGLHLNRLSSLSEPIHGVVKPSFCVIAQGSKEVLLGDSRYQYDPFNYLLATIELPSVGQILAASKECPYLSLRLELAPTLVGAVMVEAAHISPPRQTDVRALNVSPLDGNLLDAAVRIVRLLDSPAEALMLMPLITREIIYRLLIGDQGGRLRHLALLGGYTPHIVNIDDLWIPIGAL